MSGWMRAQKTLGMRGRTGTSLRCLPDVAINTLEAVRLFMFTEKTAFVIAADESMIRYAVKKHFPDAADENESYKKLRDEGLSRIRKPWNVETLKVDDIKEINTFFHKI